MRNPFLIARFVFFATLIYLNVLAIGLAAWNISSIKTAGLSGAPIFVIFNACTLFLFMVVALAELISSSARTAQVKFECGWTAVLGCMELAAAIDVSIDGRPDYCSAQAFLAVCSSSTVLVAITWASSTILVMYFLTLIITAIAHTSTYTAVWSSTVYNVPWFSNTENVIEVGLGRLELPPKAPKGPYENPVFRAADEDAEPLTPPNVPYTRADEIDIEKFGVHGQTDPQQEGDRDNMRPCWAKRVNTRRGVDHPFATASTAAKRASRVFKSYWSGATTAVPPTPPPKPELPVPKNLNGGFIDCHRGSYGQFPDDVVDHNLPIARTHLTEWVKAERAILAH